MLSDKLYDIYYEFKSAQELLVALEVNIISMMLESNDLTPNKFATLDRRLINDIFTIQHLQFNGNMFTEDCKVSFLKISFLLGRRSLSPCKPLKLS